MNGFKNYCNICKTRFPTLSLIKNLLQPLGTYHSCYSEAAHCHPIAWQPDSGSRTAKQRVNLIDYSYSCACWSCAIISTISASNVRWDQVQYAWSKEHRGRDLGWRFGSNETGIVKETVRASLPCFPTCAGGNVSFTETCWIKHALRRSHLRDYIYLLTRIGRVVGCPRNGDFFVPLALNSHSSQDEAGEGYSLGWVDQGYDFHAGKNRIVEPLVCLCFLKGHLRHAGDQLTCKATDIFNEQGRAVVKGLRPEGYGSASNEEVRLSRSRLEYKYLGSIPG